MLLLVVQEGSGAVVYKPLFLENISESIFGVLSTTDSFCSIFFVIDLFYSHVKPLLGFPATPGLSRGLLLPNLRYWIEKSR